jgi:hypothetical protein
VNDENRKTKNFTVHRISYRIHHGEIPEGMSVCHKCDTPRCANPDHLFLGTHKENMADRIPKGRSPRGSKHPGALLVESQVLEIRLRLSQGQRAYVLANEYGVASSTIGNIKRCRTWKHVPSLSACVRER